jgi:hypothetical protein
LSAVGAFVFPAAASSREGLFYTPCGEYRQIAVIYDAGNPESTNQR